MVLKANDRRTSCPCHDEFRGPRSDYARQFSSLNFIFLRPIHEWMTVDDSLFLGTWTDKQSSIPYHDVFDAGLDFVGFYSLRSDMTVIGCGDGIREEGLRDDYLELKFYTVLRA
ncbi:hypothetical protein TNCV_3251501 [Trichonephila clavipes]|nr:hypothetical protein TNCV_3251501 [Trichonephila clavipes]